MGIVTGTATGQEFRELYFPPHERAMAHYSSASPDHKSALVVEMDENGRWSPCRLISLDGRFDAAPIGPPGPCTSAGWSPDGSWMYFTASVDGHSHLWRQRFPGGEPELITSGPIEAEGIAVEPDGRSVITSMGVHAKRHLDSRCQWRAVLVVGGRNRGGRLPSFLWRGRRVLYYLLRHGSDGSGPELWRMMVESGKSEAVFPGSPWSLTMFRRMANKWSIAARERDWNQATVARPCRPKLSRQANRRFRRNTAALWTAWADLVSSDRGKLQLPGADEPGRLRAFEGGPLSNQYDSRCLARTPMGNGHVFPSREGTGVAPMAIPVDGGPPRIICADYCVPKWSSTGRFLVIPVEAPSRTGPGRSLAIPVGPGEKPCPNFRPEGSSRWPKPVSVPGAQSIARGELVPGKDPAHFAYVNTTVHRNLYRISLP